MTPIEIIILVMLSLMVVPDLCRKTGRLPLAVAAYVMLGFLLGPVLNPQARLILKEVGQFGFILLLFEIGLEIELPKLSRFHIRQAWGYVWKWILFQYPVIVMLGVAAGLPWPEALLAGCALSACSISLVLPGFGQLTRIDEARRNLWLRRMVLLEIMAVVTLSAGDVLLTRGVGWRLFIQIAGIGAAIILVGQVARHVTPHFRWILDRMIHWRVHLIVLFVLLVAAAGERLGLSAPKTAFFLGLFMNRSTHRGMTLDRHLAPVSQRLLIPVFLVSLGIAVPLELLLSPAALWAGLATIFILAYRQMVGTRLDPASRTEGSLWLTTPNLTMVAIAIHSLQEAQAPVAITSWVMFCGLFMTLAALLMMPRTSPSAP